MSDILQENKEIVRALLKRDNISEQIAALDRKPPYKVYKGETAFNVVWYWKQFISGGAEAINFDEDEIKEAVRIVLNKRLSVVNEILNIDKELTSKVEVAMLEKLNN